jgi:hypothetical protein
MPISIIKTNNISNLAGLQGPGLPDGSPALPSLTFTNDPDSGLYRISDNKIGIATAGQRVGEIGIGYGGFINGPIQIVESLLTLQYAITGAVSNTLLTSGICGAITTKVNNSKILIQIGLQGVFSGVSNNLYSIIYRHTSVWLGNIAPVGSSLVRKHILSSGSGVGILNSISQIDTPNVPAGTTLYYGNAYSNNGTGSSITINYDPAGFDSSRAYANIILTEILQ